MAGPLRRDMPEVYLRPDHEILHNRDLHPNMVILGSLTSPCVTLPPDKPVAAEAGMF
jgi:hypothetical protein